MKKILKICLLSVIRACEKYKVPFDVLLTEIAYESMADKVDKMVAIGKVNDHGI